MIQKLRLIALLLGCMLAFQLSAQASCDKLFATGVKFQQTMTVASQNKAISYFEKAKVCYDSQSKKDLCDQQITACRNIIRQLSSKAKTNTPSATSPNDDAAVSAAPAAAEQAQEKKDVKLSVSPNYLKFKGKGEEFKKAKVTCNYPDWEIAEQPDWVSCSKREGEIVVEAEKNPFKEERSGSIIIQCGDKTVTLTIIQEKFKKFVVL